MADSIQAQYTTQYTKCSLGRPTLTRGGSGSSELAVGGNTVEGHLVTGQRHCTTTVQQSSQTTESTRSHTNHTESTQAQGTTQHHTTVL